MGEWDCMHVRQRRRDLPDVPQRLGQRRRVSACTDNVPQVAPLTEGHEHEVLEVVAAATAPRTPLNSEQRH